MISILATYIIDCCISIDNQCFRWMDENKGKCP